MQERQSKSLDVRLLADIVSIQRRTPQGGHHRHYTGHIISRQNTDYMKLSKLSHWAHNIKEITMLGYDNRLMTIL